MRKNGRNILNVAVSLVLGGAILYWMYRDFDFERVREVLRSEMSWTWMLLSLPFGIMAEMLRGLRWRQSLEPLGERSRASVRIHAVFLSYAASLVVPRSGEFLRCGVLRQKDGVSFPKALGTVVTERAIDTLFVLGIALLTVASQFRMFTTFFEETGTSFGAVFHRFSAAGWLVTVVCVAAIAGLVWLLSRNQKVRDALGNIWQGVVSLRNVDSASLFILYTMAIWGCYFLHFYLTFFCFEATSSLGLGCALAAFTVGSFAVIVPTPNGAGPWHFAVKTMLILYGVGETDALYFVLIVHSIQTLLVILLGIYAWVALSFSSEVRRCGGAKVRGCEGARIAIENNQRNL